MYLVLDFDNSCLWALASARWLLSSLFWMCAFMSSLLSFKLLLSWCLCLIPRFTRCIALLGCSTSSTTVSLHWERASKLKISARCQRMTSQKFTSKHRPRIHDDRYQQRSYRILIALLWPSSSQVRCWRQWDLEKKSLRDFRQSIMHVTRVANYSTLYHLHFQIESWRVISRFRFHFGELFWVVC